MEGGKLRDIDIIGRNTSYSELVIAPSTVFPNMDLECDIKKFVDINAVYLQISTRFVSARYPKNASDEERNRAEPPKMHQTGLGIMKMSPSGVKHIV